MSLEQQYATIVLMMVSGALMGTVYDIYRTAQKEWRFLRRFSILLDVLYWVFTTVLVFTMLLGANHGDVRLVVFILLAAGWWIYALTLRKLIVASTSRLIRLLLAVYRWLVKLLWWVLAAPAVYLFNVLRRIARMINRVMGRIEAILIWPFVFAGESLVHRFLKKEDGGEKPNH